MPSRNFVIIGTENVWSAVQRQVPGFELYKIQTLRKDTRKSHLQLVTAIVGSTNFVT